MKIATKTFASLIGLVFILIACSEDSNVNPDTENVVDNEETISEEEEIDGEIDDETDEEETDNEGINEEETELNDLPDITGITGYNQSAAELNDWELIFEDDFTEDLSHWNIWTGGAFNEELQHYQASNLSVENGYLYIHGKRENVTGANNPFDTAPKNFNFTSGRIESKELYSAGNTEDATMLRISSRILLPKGDGLWPAFWSYGDPWPTEGEIDILEFRGNDTSSYVTNYFYGTTANFAITDPSQTSFDVTVEGDITENWHVFELVWSQMSFDIYFDGELVHSLTEENLGYIDDIYDKSEKIVLNMAIGGVFFNGINLEENNIPDSSYTVVDWVRVYKQ